MQNWPMYVLEWVLVVFVALVGLIILYKMLTDKIDLSSVLNEMTPAPSQNAAPAAGAIAAAPAAPVVSKASLSRLQLLLFTFVIAGLYLALSLAAQHMVDIPNQALGLLGISGGSFVVSKGIQANAG